jgi:glycosyltransferase involved in cell wall biosynthesis
MKLALFFTRGVSLEQWLMSGLFEREKLIYELHLADGTLSQVYWFTYGIRDSAFAERLYTEGRLDPRIKVFPMPKLFALPKVGSWLYSFLLPWVHNDAINAVDILKTNQLDGGWAAAIAKNRVSKPLLVRCGYVQSKLEKGLHRLPRWRLMLMMWGERKSFQAADIAVVTSHHNEQYVMDVFGLPSNRLRVIPNALDVKSFAPRIGGLSQSMLHRVLFVGRLSPEKNLINLLQAAHDTGLGLDLVGAGPEANELQLLAREIGADMLMTSCQCCWVNINTSCYLRCSKVCRKH